MAEDWVQEINPQFLPLVLAFRIKDPDLYPCTMFDDTVLGTFSASKWWLIVQKKTEKNGKLPLEFCKLMQGLHSAPASSASLERVFSTFGLVWSKLRNRLDPKKAEKLVKVYRYLRGEQPDW